MDRVMVEVWRYLRDHAKPCSQQDLADLIQVRTYAPPSKGHLKRLGSHAKLGRGNYVPAPREYAPADAVTLHNREMNEFFKTQKSIIGGTITVAPAPEPARVNRETFFTHIKPARDRGNQEPDYRAEFLRLDRKTLVALAKAGIEPDMFRIIEAYGSYDAYREAIK